MTKHALLASIFAVAAFAAPASAGFGGLYFGGHVGGIWGDVNTDTVSNTGGTGFWSLPASSTVSPSGVLGGAQLGYNFEFSSWVVGVELSGSALKLDEAAVFADDRYTVEAEWLGIAALRAGWIWNQRSLIYLKGGYAGANVQTSDLDTVAPLGATATDETHTGWMAGAGFEHMLSNDVSLAVEYDYVDLGNQDHVATPTTGGTIRTDVDAQLHAVTARLNWHFWSP